MPNSYKTGNQKEQNWLPTLSERCVQCLSPVSHSDTSQSWVSVNTCLQIEADGSYIQMCISLPLAQQCEDDAFDSFMCLGGSMLTFRPRLGNNFIFVIYKNSIFCFRCRRCIMLNSAVYWKYCYFTDVNVSLSKHKKCKLTAVIVKPAPVLILDSQSAHTETFKHTSTPVY